MRKTKKSLSVILALLVLILSFASCADKGENSNGENLSEDAGTTDGAASESEETVPETDETVVDDLPEMNFAGYTYAIYTRTATSHSLMLTEDITGEVLNDAVYERNNSVAERFNVVFAEESYSTETLPATLIQSGDSTYSLMNVRCTAANNMAQKSYCYNISDLEYINLDKPYWDKNLTEDIAVGKNYYTAIGDAQLTTIDFTNVLLFNKNLIEVLQLEDIYTLVNEGKWTFDKYGELAVSALSDLDGDGTMGKDDRYGMIGISKYMHCSLVQAADVMYVSKDADNYPVYSIPYDEKFVDVFSKIIDICNDNNAWFYTTDGTNDSPTIHNMFRNEQGLFLTTMFYLIESLRDMESEFGVIPFPKYDEAQSNYISRVSFFDTSIIPVTVEDAARASIILEALSCESHNTVIPAYYDIALKSKYARDEESSAMIDIILDNRVLDFGDTYFCESIRDGFVVAMFQNSNRDIVSSAKQREKVVNKTIEKMIEAYKLIEE